MQANVFTLLKSKHGQPTGKTNQRPWGPRGQGKWSVCEFCVIKSYSIELHFLPAFLCCCHSPAAKQTTSYRKRRRSGHADFSCRLCVAGMLDRIHVARLGGGGTMEGGLGEGRGRGRFIIRGPCARGPFFLAPSFVKSFLLLSKWNPNAHSYGI